MSNPDAALYHYTDTAHLPHILRDGFLRPGRSRVGTFPDPDFLWATDLPILDRTSTTALTRDRAERAQQRLMLDVRITLPRAEFSPWCDATRLAPVWTPAEMRRLELAAGGRSAPRNWWIRLDPLSLSLCLELEVRAARDRHWTPLPLDTPWVEDDGYVCVTVGDQRYGSAYQPTAQGRDGYAVEVVSLDELRRDAGLPVDRLVGAE